MVCSDQRAWRIERPASGEEDLSEHLERALKALDPDELGPVRPTLQDAAQTRVRVLLASVEPVPAAALPGSTAEQRVEDQQRQQCTRDTRVHAVAGHASVIAPWRTIRRAIDKRQPLYQVE